MKNKIRLLALLCAVLFAGVVTSCEEPVEPTPTPTPTPTPEYPEAKNVNTYVINGKEYAFGSVATMMLGENLVIAATPTADVSSAESIFECEEYIFGAVSPLLVGEKIDVTTEQKLFTIASTLVGAPLEGISPDYPEEATSGEVQISYEEGKATFVGWLVLADGTELAVNMEAEARVEINENVIVRGGVEKPLRSAFYKEDEGTVNLWFSPAGIDYFSELEIVTYYFHIELSEELLGRNLDIQNLPEGGKFTFELVDNADTSQSFAIGESDLKGASGSCSVERLDDETYRVLLQLTIGELSYEITFEGKCVSHALAPEVKTNYLTYGKGNKAQEITLVSAAVDCSTDVWVVTLTAADESVFTATVPENFFTGEAKGFSQSPNLTVTYKERTYSKVNGDSGTIWASLTILDSPQEAPMLNFEFMGYDDLSCIYSGDCTLTE